MQQMIRLWARNTAVLSGDGSERSAMQHLMQAVEALDVTLHISGELPRQSETQRLLVMAANEALNNAVRHAGATELRIALTTKARVCTAVIENNGRPPYGDIAEGGGLSALRHRLEAAGGALCILPRPVFQMIVTVPEKEA